MPEINDPSLLARLNGGAPSQGGGLRPVTIGTPDPKVPLEVDKLRQGLEVERERLRLAQQQAALDAEREKRAAGDDARKQTATDARGGVDTSENERKAAFLATRVAGGIRDLARIGDIGAPSLKDATVGSTLIGNYSTDEDRQRAINAQLDILDAALTLGTGAAYNREQLDAYRQTYFPQPGDKAKTIEDKQRRLQTLMNAARIQAGAASGLIDSAISESGVFKGTDATQPSGLTDADKDFLSKNARNLGEDGIRQFLSVRGLKDEKGIADAVKYYGGGGQGDATVNYNDTPVSQGLSGVNEGIASTLGALPDLANTVLNLGAKGVNYLAGTDFAMSDKPTLGSNWWKEKLTDVGSIGPESERSGMPFVRRVGQSVGAAAIPGLATARTPAQVAALLASSTGGGIGAATAKEVAPGNPWAEMGGELVGSGLFGIGALTGARRAAQRKIEAAVPTIDQLKKQASNLYNAAESRGIVAGPNVTANLAGRVSDIADKEKLVWPNGKVDPSYPRAGAAMDMLNAHAGGSIDPKQIQVLRDNLSDAVGATQGKERRISQQMLNAFDDETVPLAPELLDARRIASRYLSAEQIKRASDLSEPRAAQFSQSGMGNALKTEFRKLDRNQINGDYYPPDLAEAVRRVSRGTPTSNALQQIGKAAPTGVVSTGFSAGVPFMIGNAVGGPVAGTAASAATMGGGALARMLAENAITRQANLAELVARNGGKLPKPQVMTPELQRLVAAGLFGQQSQYTGN